MTHQKPTIIWPLKNIRVPGDNDVVFGRGGASIHHPGCKSYRDMVRSHQRQYIGYDDSRHMKTLLTHELVKKWREQTPPGRFLKKDEATGLWHDVGTKDARRKTAQLLREGAKAVRSKMQAESDASSEEDNNSYAAPPESVPKKLRQPKQQSLVEFAASRGLAAYSTTNATPVTPNASMTETISPAFTLPAPALGGATAGEEDFSPIPLEAQSNLLDGFRDIVRTSPPCTFQYKAKNSTELAKALIGDMVDFDL